jgi:DNA-binding HxlR family transcriptional regulator
MEKSEHALAIIKAGVSAVPCIGGPIASLISDYIPTATEKSIKTAINLLSERLRELEDRIDVNKVDKDEFAELFKSSYLCIVRTHQKAKLDAAVSLIANILLKDGDKDKLTYRELDHYARCIDGLSIGALEVLGEIYKSIDLERMDPSVLGSHKRIDFGSLHARMKDINAALLMGLLEELNALHLIHLTGVPSVRTPEYSNYPIERTQLGDRFMRHLMKVGKI